MQNEHIQFGAYFIHHNATKKFFINSGDLLFSRHYEYFLLLLGIHYNKELQKAYNLDNNFTFTIFKETNNEIEAIKETKYLLNLSFDKGWLFNENKEPYIQPLFNHSYVDSIFDDTKHNNKIYKDICVYVWINNQTNEFYIGSGDKNSREYRHLYTLNKQNHFNKKFQLAYNRNPNFEFYWVPMKTRKEAYAFEQTLLDVFWNKPGFLNTMKYVDITTGFYGRHHSEETKEKLRITSSKRWQNPEERIRQGNLSKQWHANLTEEEKAIQADKLRISTTSLWKKPEYRTKVVERINNAFINNPEIAKRRGIALSETLKKPEMRLLKSNRAKKLWENPIYRNKVIELVTKAANAPEERKRRSIVSKTYFNRPEVKKANLLMLKNLFNNEEYRNKNRERMLSYNVDRSKRISIHGKIYSSIRVANRETGISRTCIKKYLKDKNNSDFTFV